MKHFDNIINYSILFAFIAISILIAPYHEPWADEIQAFLIARDASFWEIISVIPHQEAQPPLWHLFLKSMIIIFGKDLNITYISIFIMSLTVGIFVFKYKIPLIYKILIPFGHSFLYQYNIISRNYCLAIFAIVLFGLLYKDRHKYIWRYSFILIFLAYTTSFYAPIAFCFGLLWILEIYFQHKNNIKKYILPVLTLAMFGIILLWQIFPIENAAINIRVTFDYHKHYNILAHTFDALFIGNNKIINLLFLVIISLYLIINNKFYQMIVNNKLNCIYIILILGSFFTIYLYSKYLFYHQGLLYTLLLILIYIFNKAMKINLLLVAILCMQIFWSVEIIKYDIKENYSIQYETLNILSKHNKLNDKILTVGYKTLPLQALLKPEQLYLQEDEKIYWRWTKADLEYKYDTMQNLLNNKVNVLIISKPKYPYYNLDYYNNTNLYYKYDINSIILAKGYIPYEQGVYLFIKK